MEHQKFQEQVNFLFDGLLNDEESAAVFAHLAGCKACRDFLKAMKQVGSHLSEEGLPRVPRSVEQRIASTILENRVASERQPFYAKFWLSKVAIPLPAAASILLLIVFSSLLLSPLIASGQPEQRELPPELNSQVSRFLQQPF